MEYLGNISGAHRFSWRLILMRIFVKKLGSVLVKKLVISFFHVTEVDFD